MAASRRIGPWLRRLCTLVAIGSAIGIAVFSSSKVPAEQNNLLAAVCLAVCALACVANVRLAPSAERVRAFWELPTAALFFFLGAAVVYPVLQGARAASSSTRCHAATRQLALGVLLYAADHNDRLPPASRWRDLTNPDASNLRCPSAKGPWTYAFNRPLGGLLLESIDDPMETIMIFEADGLDPNMSGGRDSFLPRHSQIGRVATCDGAAHSAAITDARFRWKP